MTSPRKIDVTLIIGLTIPVVMIVLIAGAIHYPRIVTGIEDPRYDFLYTVGYPEEHRFHVADGRLLRTKWESEDGETDATGDPHLQFYIHRVGENASERLSFEKASDLRLDNSALSPDGFEIAYGRRSEIFFPFWSSRDYRTRYLCKESLAIKLNLETSESFRTAHSFKFLGWIEE